MQYREPRSADLQMLFAAIESGDHDLASEYVTGISLSGANLADGVQACVVSAGSVNDKLRGNAILGFGHLARRFGELDRALVEPLVAAGLRDPSGYVRSHAESAADDLSHFLGWHISRWGEEPR